MINKRDIVEKFGSSKSDTGNTKVQVALLTEKINYLTSHLREHNKDHASRLGLMKAVGKRRRLLDYLKRTNIESYKNLIKELGIRK
tara:strand:+ start:206 stop:463 length:258 start_codon:yes stop_codon:yes gene_type:complete